ncbi:Uncharacterised protein [Vibrio cholerae]|nr:Uncharacterised protein [Vibrio cholerae]CSC76631.1 Uncharacterised protein [Vibrio cholerae]
MRVAHTHRAAKQGVFTDTQNVGFFALFGAKWDLVRLKLRHTHVHGDQIFLFHIEYHFAFLGTDMDGVLVG